MPITLAHVLTSCAKTGLEEAKQVLSMPRDQPPWYELKPAPDEEWVDEANWRCLVVDVYDSPDRKSFDISREQYYWLVKKLRHAEDRGHAVLIALHRSPIQTEETMGHPRSSDYQETMKKLMEVVGQFRYTIRAVISGDGSEHHRNIDGINFIGKMQLILRHCHNIDRVFVGIPSLVDEEARALGGMYTHCTQHEL